MSVAYDHGFLPSGKYIFNHDIMNCTADGVVGNHLYSGRALGITEPWDLIQLHPELQSEWHAITRHYDRINLKHSKNVIWNLDYNELGSHIGFHPSVFYFGPTECRYWGDHAWMEAVEFINSKNNFIRTANELGVDVPRTLCLDRIGDINESIEEYLSFPLYLKAAVSVSGVGIHRCEDMFEFIKAVNTFDADTPVQIQENLVANSFLNMQYEITDDQLIRLVASEQILDGCAHQGNRVPSRYEPWSVVEPLAVWLKDRGMKGIFAFDVAVTQTDRGLRFPVVECNPRFNGATYPSMIANKLGIKQWSAVNLKCKYEHLSEVDLSGLEFDSESGVGAIVVNWGVIITKKLSLLLAGTPEQQLDIRQKIQARI